MNVLVIGQGAVGRALVTALTARKIPVEGRSLRHDGFLVDEEHDVVIYAAGLAGERACRANPEDALWAHYNKTLDLAIWVGEQPTRRGILIGTTITAGLYGALKEIGAEGIRDYLGTMSKGGGVLHLRCGQIIGPEMPVDGTGVVATWIRRAVRGEPLHVTPWAPPLDLTLLADLADRIVAWLRSPITSPWEEERLCIPDPLDLATLSLLCTEAALKQVSVPTTHWDVRRALAGMAENAR